MKKLLLFMLLAIPLAAQINNGGGTLNGSGAPTGSCSAGQLYTNNTSGEVYGCQAGSWLLTGPGAAGATNLNSVLDPTANKAFTMGAFTLNFNTSSNSSTANPFSFSDFATNTGTGYLFTVSSGSSSAVKPFRVCYRGTSNCINMDTTTLTTSGTAVIDATKLSGNLPALNGASLTNVDAATLQTHAASYFQQALTLTTTGSSGAATLVGGTLNIPQYTAGGGITNSAPNLHLGESDGTNIIDSGIVRSTNDYNFPGAVNATTSSCVGASCLTACGSAPGCSGMSGSATRPPGQAGAVTMAGNNGGTAALFTFNAGSEGPLNALSGGTGSQYFTVSGPTAARTYTFPDSNQTMLYSGGALGTPASGTLTNATGLPAAGVVAGALANGMTATTQTDGDNSTKVSTTAYVDGHAVAAAKIPAVTVTISTSSPVTVSTTLNSAFYFNQNATAGTAMTFNLPTAAAGKQFCFRNSYNGSAANTGALTLATSAAGQFIIDVDGTIGSTGGNIASGGAGGDAACVVGVDSTHWQVYVQKGTWTKS